LRKNFSVEIVNVKRAALLLALASSLRLSAQQRNMREFLGLGPPPDPAAVKLGEPLYKENCAACHGQNARGGEGPNLVRSAVVLHDEKGEEIGQVVKNGRPQAGMPAFPQLKREEIYQIAEYLHQQVDNAANRGLYNSLYANQRGQTSGEAKKGEEFFKANCAGCHSATGDLAKIGSKYPMAATMQARFIWPASRSAGKATVKTPSGETVSGTVVRLDDFDVSLRDENGEYHSWPRSAVQVEADDKLDGHRALLPKYTDTDLHNLTAYLLTLK
jgi:cytochrome c oxidase cbb3-type subunit III